MVDLIKKNTFLEDKNLFFSKPSISENVSTTIRAIDLSVEKKDYAFLLENQITLEAEFLHMFTVLKKQKNKDNEAFWMYCYYTASLLEAFYKAYSQETKESTFKKYKQQIKDRLESVAVEKEVEENFIQSLERNIVSGFQNMAKMPFHLSILRDYVAFSNLNRLYWLFSRLTFTKGLFLLKEFQWIESLDALLGIHTDIDKIISTLETPNNVLYFFSVSLFLMRFMIDTTLLLRHTFFPTDSEKKEKVSAFDRFKYELYKRHCNFANDLVWAIVNFLTNFTEITHISASIANGITVVCLGFDFSMALYKCYLAYQEYLAKKQEYDQQIKAYNDRTQFTELSPEERNKHIDLLNAQNTELRIDWQTKESTFYFVASAAALLMAGFSAALILSPPGIIFTGYFMCHLAIAMYLSSGSFGKYKEKSLRWEQDKVSGNDLVVADKELNCARRDFILTMTKNAIIPIVLITTFALYWPAAIALTILYLGYELLRSYQQHTENKELESIRIGNAP